MESVKVLKKSEMQMTNNQEQTLRIAGVVKESIVDGPGIRFVVFSQGCPHHCPGCHNAVTHDFEGGYDCSIERILAEIDANPLLDGVTFSGGEPACQPGGFLALAREIKKRGLSVIMYSGYTFEDLFSMAKMQQALAELLPLVDILIDGKYEENLRDLTLPFRGSKNQRVIDLAASLSKGSAVVLENF